MVVKVVAILKIRDRTSLAILNLHVDLMPPTNFQFNQTYGLVFSLV